MAADVDIAGLSHDSVGQRLKRARTAAGKTLAEVSLATKIPERSLIAIEGDRFAELPSRIYAIGFSRSYARLVGLDETAVVADVRAELDGALPAHDVAAIQAFAPGDPARVPGRRLAIIAGLGAAAVFVGALAFWHGSTDGGGPLPSILPASAPGATGAGRTTPPPGQAARNAAMAPTPSAGGVVTISALAPGIWLKIYEAAGRKLFEGQLAQGQGFTVPADAQAPLIWTGRPDALAITVGGKPVARLAEKQKIVKNVPISAAALLARGLPAPVPASSTATPLPMPTAAVSTPALPGATIPGGPAAGAVH